MDLTPHHDLEHPAAGNRSGHGDGPASPAVPSDAAEADLVAALRRGDERAFQTLVERHHGALVRLARVWLRDGAAAEEAAQETWLAVLRGLDGFAGRGKLQSWIFSILVNQAKSRAIRDRRTISFSALTRDDDDGRSVDPDRFFPTGHPDAGHWNRPVTVRSGDPESYLLSNEVSDRVIESIAALPANHRAVITLRDVENRSAEEVCAILDLTPGNQRVLLHRARSKVRAALEPYLRASDEDDHAATP